MLTSREALIIVPINNLRNLSMQNVIDLLPEDSLLLEPRIVFDSCLVGVTDTPKDRWPRKEKRLVAVYDIEKSIKAISIWLDCSEDEATDWFYYNTAGAWVGEGTPTFTSSVLSDEE